LALRPEGTASRTDSADQGLVEIIVAKHRNGPTGKVRLAFVEHLTRFANLADAGVPSR
jgi:replicative DNA helicase